METLFLQQPALTTLLKFLTFLGSLIIVVILAIYNMLYLLRVLNSNKQVGLRLPEHIHHLVRVSIFVPFFTAIFIMIFLALRWY
ncbi:MAG TPA: hypothetical protein VE090_04645 [Methylomirabilota bacterium]|nr:hypothetical protein [Methylomirabilota bacterium]